MANYELYQGDGVTPIAIPQPLGATWERAQVSRRASGVARREKYARVVWTFGPITKAQLAIFESNRPANGAMNFKTYVRPGGATPPSYAKCAGLMEPIDTGRERDTGMVEGLTITWIMVEVV